MYAAAAGSTQIYLQVRTQSVVISTVLYSALSLSVLDSNSLSVPFLPPSFPQGPSHQASNLSANTPSPGPYVSDQYGMYAARLS